MNIDEGHLRFTGLTFSNIDVDFRYLPGRSLGEETLYHMFASGLFEHVEIYYPWNEVKRYDRSAMARYVSERDRLQIRRLQAEVQAKIKEEIASQVRAEIQKAKHEA